MELDPVARDIVLRNVREAVPSRWSAKVDELRALHQRGPVSLAEYLHETGLELSDIYGGDHTWSSLREDAGLPVAPAGPESLSIGTK